MRDNVIQVYTDGACSGNPGKGGWAAVLMYKGHKKTLSKGYRFTTNNRMELMAVIEALKAIKNKNLPVIVYSDSAYVVNNINNGYIYNWKNKQLKGVKNPDLWNELIELIQSFKDIRFIWVKGHSHNVLNNECDTLAVKAYASEDNHLLAKDVYYEDQLDKGLSSNLQ